MANNFLQGMNIGFNGFNHASEVLALDGSQRKTRMLQQDTQEQNMAIRDADLKMRQKAAANREARAKKQDIFNVYAEARRQSAEERRVAEEARRNDKHEQLKKQFPAPELWAIRQETAQKVQENKLHAAKIRQAIASGRMPPEARQKAVQALTALEARSTQMEGGAQKATRAVLMQQKINQMAEARKVFHGGNAWPDDAYNAMIATGQPVKGEEGRMLAEKGLAASDMLATHRKELSRSDPTSVKTVVQAAYAKGIIGKGLFQRLSQQADLGSEGSAAVHKMMVEKLQSISSRKYSALSAPMYRDQSKFAHKFNEKVVTPLRASVAAARQFATQADDLIDAATNPEVGAGHKLAINNAMTKIKDVFGQGRTQKDISNLNAASTYDQWQVAIASLVRNGAAGGAMLAGSVSDFEFKKYISGAPSEFKSMWKNLTFGITAKAMAAARKAELAHYDNAKKHFAVPDASMQKGAQVASQRAFLNVMADQTAAQLQRVAKIAQTGTYKNQSGETIYLTSKQQKWYQRTALNMQRVAIAQAKKLKEFK